jgi:hypothetical protein
MSAIEMTSGEAGVQMMMPAVWDTNYAVLMFFTNWAFRAGCLAPLMPTLGRQQRQLQPKRHLIADGSLPWRFLDAGRSATFAAGIGGPR